MKLLGAEVRPVTAGHGTLKDAMNEALRDWVTNVEDTYYLIGTAAGPHPYPELVRDFQSVIGTEARAQILEQEGRLPDVIIAAVGGGSNAIGMFHPFLDDRSVQIIGIEAGGRGLDGVEHCASMNAGKPGVLHGNRTYLLQNDDGQILDGHSISAGLDYPGVGPEHSWLRDTGRVDYVPILDDEALEAFQLTTKRRGHHSGAGIRPCHRPCGEDRADAWARTRSSSSISPAAATRTCTPSPRCSAWRFDHDHPHRPPHGETEGRRPPGARHLFHGRRSRL